VIFEFIIYVNANDSFDYPLMVFNN